MSCRLDGEAYVMAAVDADLEAGNPRSALARLEEFLQKHARPDDDLLVLLEFEEVLQHADGDAQSA